MDQKYETHWIDDQLIQLPTNYLEYFPASSFSDESIGDPISEFNGFNDVIALQSFVKSVHGALRTNDQFAIKMALGLLDSSEKYPHLNNAVGAFASVQYQAALYAADVARQEAQRDTSVNRSFAFCAASLLMAHAHKRLGESKLVVDVLTTCQEQLEEEVGPIAKQLINEVLASFFL